MQSSHGLGLNESIELAKRSGIKMPDEISVYAVEVGNPYEFGESILPEIEQKVPAIVKQIVNAVHSQKEHCGA